MKEKLRIYTVIIERSVASNSKDCTDFRSAVKSNFGGSRKILNESSRNDSTNCIMDLEMECESCGKQGLHKLKKRIWHSYPDAVFTQIKRKRKNGKSGK